MSDMPAAEFAGFPQKRTIPAKVAAAMEYLKFADQLRNPPAYFDGTRPESRDLSKKEQAVYDAALEVLRTYFMGEQDFEPGAGPARPDDDEPKSREPVTA